MHSLRPRLAVATALMMTAPLVTGCDGVATGPDEDAYGTAAPPTALAAVEGRHRVTGGGLGDLTEALGLPFKAISQIRVSVAYDPADPFAARGSFGNAFHRPPGQDPTPRRGNGDFRLTVNANCAVVDGNIAWISGPATKVRSDLPFPMGPELGRTVLMIVRDDDVEGDAVIAIAADFLGVEDCRDMPDPSGLFLSGVESGGEFTIR